MIQILTLNPFPKKQSRVSQVGRAGDPRLISVIYGHLPQLLDDDGPGRLHRNPAVMRPYPQMTQMTQMEDKAFTQALRPALVLRQAQDDRVLGVLPVIG